MEGKTPREFDEEEFLQDLRNGRKDCAWASCASLPLRYDGAGGSYTGKKATRKATGTVIAGADVLTVTGADGALAGSEHDGIHCFPVAPHHPIYVCDVLDWREHQRKRHAAPLPHVAAPALPRRPPLPAIRGRR